MVHALDEVRRVLKRDGILLDIRPVEDQWTVEIATAERYEVAGKLNDMPIGIEDDAAAFRAMDEAESRGWFKKEHEAEFSFFYYWDTPSEMKEFLDEEWEDFEKLEEDVYQKAKSLWASASGDAQLRVRVKMHISRWIKISHH
jgi:hypothetical protein